jgi:hypothetical protein
MHLVDRSGKKVELRPGDLILFRWIDSSITIRLERSSSAVQFKKDDGHLSRRISLDSSGTRPVDPVTLMRLMCHLLGLSFRLIRNTKEFQVFELTKSE